MSLLILLFWRRQYLASWPALFFLLIEVILINLVLWLNGGVTNPFNAILLLPVIVAFLTQPVLRAVTVWSVANLAQLAQLVLAQLTITPAHGLTTTGMAAHSGTSVNAHFVGMVISFVITSSIVSILIIYLQGKLAQREQAIIDLREKKLRDEQLLALGTAAAQLSHEVASPIQTIHLMMEEALDDYPDMPIMQQVNSQFTRIERALTNWRTIANDIRDKKRTPFHPTALMQQVQHLMTLARPEASIQWQFDEIPSTQLVSLDHSLAPALLNIIVNACEAAQYSSDNLVVVHSRLVLLSDGQNHHSTNQWQLTIENEINQRDSANIEQLGQQLLASDKGLGMGALISNVTIEQLNGRIDWHIENNRLTTTVIFKLIET